MKWQKVWGQTGLLLWKNALIKRSQLLSTVSEVLLPVCFVLLIMWLQSLDPDETTSAQVYTCPKQSGLSPTLLIPLKKKEHFWLEISTEGDGPGLKTVPPLFYLLLLASKTKSQIALAPATEDPELRAWVERFRAFLSRATEDFLSPEWSRVSGLLEDTLELSLCSFENVSRVFASRQELHAYVTSEDYATTSWARGCPGELDHPRLHMAFILDSVGSGGQSWEYTIQTNISIIPLTYPNLGYTSKVNVGVDSAWNDKYLMSGFTTMQLMADRFILNEQIETDASLEKLAVEQVCDSIMPLLRVLKHLNHSHWPPSRVSVPLELRDLAREKAVTCQQLVELAFKVFHLSLNPFTLPTSYLPNDVRIAEFPTPAYTSRDFYTKIQDVFALCLVLTYLWPVSRLIRGIVHEKEAKLREGMRMMGLLETPFYLAWFLTYGAIFLVVSLSITALTRPHLLHNSSPTLVFTYFFLFGLDIIGYCFVVSVLFDKARTASIAGVVLFFMGFFAYFAVNNDNAPLESKAWSCLLAPTAFGLGASVLAKYEAAGEGVTWSTFHQTLNESQVSFAYILTMMLIDLVLYVFLAYYLSNVVQQEYGVRRPWYFLCSSSFWRENNVDTGSGEKAETRRMLLESRSNSSMNLADGENPVQEEPSQSLKHLEEEQRCVRLIGLRKEFGEKTAVAGLNLTMYEGEIFVLLGHNGAGKTTTISMLTGLIPPTRGTAKAYGEDISTGMDTIRKSLGICPQHDVLFDELTVEEHLRFYANLKETQNMTEAVEKQIKEVGLQEKRNVPAAFLSGGQRRKLSVAVALIGDSKVVFLDEPTSGMDVWARRHTWNLLQNNRNGRVIILTTHFMDEADILGDRIAIMANGKLKCCGSSLFLKSRYGVGYQLSFALKNSEVDAKRITDFIQSQVPESTTLDASGSQLLVQIPLKHAPLFGPLFKGLDARLQDLQIEAYGASITTLEEVFMRIASNSLSEHATLEPNLQSELDQEEIGEGSALENDLEEQLLHGRQVRSEGMPQKSVFWQQFQALYIKRRRYSSRDRKTICCNTLLPVLLLLLGLILLKAFPLKTPPALKLDVDQYKQEVNYVPFNSSENGPVSFAKYLPPKVVGVEAEIPQGLNGSCAEEDGKEIFDSSNLRGMSEWLLKHAHENKSSLYGAFQIDSESPLRLTLLTNSSSFHGAGVFLNLVDEALIKYHGKGEALSASNQPFPFTAKFRKLVDSFAAVSASIIIMIAFSFVPASIASFVVKEREISAKHQQLISGASLNAYWTSAYCWDMSMYVVPWVLTVLLVWSFGISSFQGDNLLPVALLFFAYGLAICPFTYCLSHLFSSHSNAQNAILLINFLTGLVLMIASFVMRVLESTRELNKSLLFVYRLFPGFCLGNGLLELTIESSIKSLGAFKPPPPLSLKVLGYEIIYLFAESVVYFVLAVGSDYLLNYPKFRKSLSCCSPALADLQPTTRDVDVDVKKEEERVDSDKNGDADTIVVKHLRKIYGNGTVAVDDISFGVSDGECFGFLGVNGAGKTSTLKIVTGDILPTAGNAYINGTSILEDQSSIRRLIGYCPQFDALLEYLTAREHLELYARLKCVPEQRVQAMVEERLRTMNLKEFEAAPAGTLSGGNKRKLSVAIAMIGSPRIIFLDEPSSGMDVMNRRFMWNIITRDILRRRSATLILTSHSMEECEALCTRIGIMVKGRLQCIGPIQHLKSRFGTGLIVDIKLVPPTTAAIHRAVNFMHSRLKIKRKTSPLVSTVLHVTETLKGSWLELTDKYEFLPAGPSLYSCRVVRKAKAHSDEDTVVMAVNNTSVEKLSYEKVLDVLQECRDEGEEIALVVSTADELTKPNSLLYREDLESACEALGDASRIGRLNLKDESGWVIASLLEKDGCVTEESLCSWWLSESMFLAIRQMLGAKLKGETECLEHRGLHSRWRTAEGNGIGDVFSELEESKYKYGISEYAVGQTTLEQIFMRFASRDTADSQQDSTIRGVNTV